MADSISFEGSIPDNYHDHLGPMFFEEYAKDMASRAVNAKPKTVLEIAAGTGIVTAHLARQLPDITITATDLNPAMLERARKHVSSNNVEWKTADMLDLPFQDNSFDLIVCQFGMMFVPDKVEAFRQMRRVLKDGGRILFSTWHSLDNMKFAKHADRVINSFFQDNPLTFYQLPFSYYDEDKIKKDLNEAGFKEVNFEHVKKETRADSESAVRGLLEGNPVITGINERNPDKLSEIKEKLKTSLLEEFGPDPLRCPLHALVVEVKK